MKASGFLTRSIFLLSLVSLLTDISSEMLYPIMPIYLGQIGFSVLWIGILEGFTQFVVGVSTGYFGEYSDRIGKRLPFVKAGYFLSTICKPLIVFTSSLPLVFGLRTLERGGKGLRTGARDAMLADEANHKNAGRVFGFHRAMDTTGAAIGPIIALVYLCFFPGDYRSLFLYAFFPGLIAVLSLFLIREKKIAPVLNNNSFNFFSFLSYRHRADKNYLSIVNGLFVFGLLNSSDAFLFLQAKLVGLNEKAIISAYVFYNLVYAISSYPFGRIADKFGMKQTMISGLLIYILTYIGFAFLKGSFALFALFGMYGIFAAMTEGISKAWISKHCLPEDKGVAQGYLKSTTSIAALFGGIIAGIVWMKVSPAAVFIVSAVGAGIVVFMWVFGKVKE